MKIIIKKYIVLVSVILFVSFNVVYADSAYDTTLKNDSDYTLYVKLVDFKCMTYIKGLPLNISPHSSTQIKLRDNGNESSLNVYYGEDDGSHTNTQEDMLNGALDGSIKNVQLDECEGDGKYITLSYEFKDEYGNSIDSGLHDLVRFKHEKGHPDSGDWYSNIYITHAQEYDENDMAGRLMLVNATCKGHDCHDQWYEHGGDADLLIETADANYFKSIGLGAVTVTDGTGKLVKVNEVNLDSTEDVYIFHFTNTQESCYYGDKMVNCDNGLGSTFRSESLVFFCRQANTSDVSCPWASTSEESDNYNSNINIY